jgi:pyruvate dehydrogenase E2 component (dihydrolipoyllysine-residue acetyltransferase)
VFEVRMPQLGETVSTGTVNVWLKAVGDVVRADDPLLEVGTDKVDTEVEAQADGTLLEIKVGEGDEVPVGTVIAVIG